MRNRGGTLSLETNNKSLFIKNLLNCNVTKQLLSIAVDKNATNDECRIAAENFANEFKKQFTRNKNNVT